MFRTLIIVPPEIVMLHTQQNTNIHGSSSSLSTYSSKSTASSSSESSCTQNHLTYQQQYHITRNIKRASLEAPVNMFSSNPNISLCGRNRTFNGTDNQELSHSATSETAGNINGTRRSRTIRLSRPCQSGTSRRAGAQPTVFGFAVRGGREFGIGFFVSRIDRGGEADLRGLKVCVIMDDFNCVIKFHTQLNRSVIN